MGAVLAMPMQDERKSSRLPLSGKFEYLHDDGQQGEAYWRSISTEGACIQLGSYLRPGRQMRAVYHGVEMTLRVVWCRPVDAGKFVAGVQVLRGGPELALVTLMAVVQRMVGVQRALN